MSVGVDLCCKRRANPESGRNYPHLSALAIIAVFRVTEIAIMSDPQVLIVGAGLSGLACAIELNRRGIECQIFEASGQVGGRVSTDRVDGFLLDRGFQVFLTSYPEAPKFLDYESLELKKFKAGAIIRYQDSFCRISDVMRHPGDLPGNVFSQAGSITDKLKIAALRTEVAKQSIAEIEAAENITTQQRLKQFGFSQRIIDSFFRPFFGGVFLESNLATSRRMFDFVFKMFASGDATLPASGMGQIPQQMAANLPSGTIQFNCPVKSINNNTVQLENGESVSARQIVLATDQNSANRLLNNETVENVGVTCLYFAANESPVNEPILVLNGDPADGPINNLCVPSDVATAYAPDGQALISITVLGVDHDQSSIIESVLQQVRKWYGEPVDQWRHLKTYEIKHSLPKQNCSDLETVKKPLLTKDGIYRCGDYLDFASIQGALASGRKIAEQVSEA